MLRKFSTLYLLILVLLTSEGSNIFLPNLAVGQQKCFWTILILWKTKEEFKVYKDKNGILIVECGFWY